MATQVTTQGTTQVLDNGASLKIITAEGTRNILKNQIREISVINDTVVKIDIGQGALSNIFLDFSDVASPQAATPDALSDALNAMLATSTNISGFATAQNQQTEITELRNIKTNQKLSKPLLSDESNPRAIYIGYAEPGSQTSDAVWAIQKIVNNRGVITHLWAAGNQNFDKVWDNRKALQYS